MPKEFQSVQLGDRVKDPISGLTGIANCITYWLHGCIRIGVKPEVVHDAKPAEEQYFDQSQLVIVKRGVHAPMILRVQAAPEPEKRRGNGGPVREGSGFSR